MSDQEPKKRRSLLARIFSGQWLSLATYKRNLPSVILVVAVLTIYITFKYETQMKISTIIRLNDELANSKTNMVSASSKYASEIRESELTEKLDTLHLYLKVAEQPPYYLDNNREGKNDGEGEEE